MAIQFGAITLNDTDRVFQQSQGQTVIWDAVQQEIDAFRAEQDKFRNVFVASTTSDFKRRYKSVGGGRLQRRGRASQVGATKVSGEWDVAFPLYDLGDAVAWDDVAFGYMTAQELRRNLDSVFVRDTNSYRFEILRCLLNNTSYTFVDDLHGSLTIVPGANGDAVTYPPVIGSEVNATDDHYLETGYAASAISDTNNPFVTQVATLKKYQGVDPSGSYIVSFINSAQADKARALTDFTEVLDGKINQNGLVREVQGLPSGLPGIIIGRCSGLWVVQWDWIPAGYSVAVDPDQESPLIERVDPADTNLGQGLQLVAKNERFPFQESFFRHRFGDGFGNRLNICTLEFGTGGTYTIPTGYSW